MTQVTTRNVIAAAAFLFLMAVSNADADCNFAETCKDIQLEGPGLVAVCKTKDGYDALAFIDLDLEIGNKDGQLVYPGTGFSLSCSRIELIDGHVLSAYCTKNFRFESSTSTIDLNNCFQNYNGKLLPCSGSVENAAE
ncbi:hypothetical protein KP509_22G070200 [Ceratopteris richardii]|uniref:Cyanovirin-N domain-containing protein n=1 Tax=Ceratopteris richardii TaxID=49495 RepID=A0A8T2S674_CERRI|nr:hypothetical protein KP509_22G070200 [Ceratopteris richardii]